MTDRDLDSVVDELRRILAVPGDSAVLTVRVTQDSTDVDIDITEAFPDADGFWDTTETTSYEGDSIAAAIAKMKGEME